MLSLISSQDLRAGSSDGGSLLGCEIGVVFVTSPYLSYLGLSKQEPMHLYALAQAYM